MIVVTSKEQRIHNWVTKEDKLCVGHRLRMGCRTCILVKFVWLSDIHASNNNKGRFRCVPSVYKTYTLRWRHNGRDSVSNYQPHDCLLNRLFRRRSKKTSKLRVTGLCVGSSPGPVNSPHKWPVTWKMFPFDDVIMLHANWPPDRTADGILVETFMEKSAWFPTTLSRSGERLKHFPCRE